MLNDGLARIIRFQFDLDPYDKNTLFLFCGKRTDRIRGLIWEGDGFLLLYKPSPFWGCAGIRMH